MYGVRKGSNLTPFYVDTQFPISFVYGMQRLSVLPIGLDTRRAGPRVRTGHPASAPAAGQAPEARQPGPSPLLLSARVRSPSLATGRGVSLELGACGKGFYLLPPPTISSTPGLCVPKCVRAEARKLAGPPDTAVYTEEMSHTRGGRRPSCDST